MPSLLTATEITVCFGDRAVLDAATLGIQEGDRIGLVGRNGGGKTTFLRILAGLQAPDSGDVGRRRDLVVSYLPQDFMLDGGTFLVVTHDRYFLDRVAKSILELCDGKFFSHVGNYTDYLLDKAERQAADAVIEHKRQMFLKKELVWVRQGPRAQRSKQKDRFERYYETAAQDGPAIEEEVELCIPPPPPLGNRV